MGGSEQDTGRSVCSLTVPATARHWAGCWGRGVVDKVEDENSCSDLEVLGKP